MPDGAFVERIKKQGPQNSAQPVMRGDVEALFPAVQNGGIVLSERPGLGIEPDIARLKDFRVAI